MENIFCFFDYLIVVVIGFLSDKNLPKIWQLFMTTKERERHKKRKKTKIRNYIETTTENKLKDGTQKQKKNPK